MRRTPALLAAAVVFPSGGGCLGLLDSPPGLLGGAWRAVDAHGEPVEWLITLSLSESHDAWVTGNGSVLVGPDTVAVTVNGPHTHPGVELTLRLSDGSTFGVFSGRVVRRDSVPGYFSSGRAMVLVRIADPATAEAARP